MLPYTTYNIPESPKDKTGNSKNWLWLVVQKPLNDIDSELLEKISAALKADFAQEVRCFQPESESSFSLGDILNKETRLIISFGVPPSALGIWIDLPSPGIRILESYSFILTLSLEALSKNSNAKKDLWKSMQVYLEQKLK